MTIRFQNENPMASIDGEIVATVPDLISILNQGPAQAITTPLPLMLYDVYLYCASRSLRLALGTLEPIMERSHVPIWNWVQRFSSIADRFSTDRASTGCSFIDESLIRIKGKECWLWIAYEPHLDA